MRASRLNYRCILMAMLALSVASPVAAQSVRPRRLPAGLIDDRARFRQIFCALNADHGALFPFHRSCDDALQRLAGEAPALPPSPPPRPSGGRHLHIVIIPGIFGQCVKAWALPFQDGAAYLRTQGYRIDTVDVDGRSSSAHNAKIIAKFLARALKPNERLMILGYSKGTSDIIETMFLYPKAIPAGSAVVTVSGVVSGTPIADEATAIYRAFSWMPLPDCKPGDKGGVESLTRRHRLAWLASHPLPDNRVYFSIAAFTDSAHISLPLKAGYAELSRFDSHNDGQIIYTDALFPRGHLLAFVNADHWAVTLPLARNAPAIRPVFRGLNDFPREILFEAIVRAVEEQLYGASQHAGGLR